MPRKPEIDRPTQLSVMFPTSIRARLDAFLYSELEQRVPQGAYQRFFIDRIREFFDSKTLDLSPYISSISGEIRVSGSPEAIELLKRRLEE